MLAHYFVLLTSISISTCATIVFDGRVPGDAALADFDSADSIFDPEFTKGESQFLLLESLK